MDVFIATAFLSFAGGNLGEIYIVYEHVRDTTVNGICMWCLGRIGVAFHGDGTACTPRPRILPPLPIPQTRTARDKESSLYPSMPLPKGRRIMTLFPFLRYQPSFPTAPSPRPNPETDNNKRNTAKHVT